MKTVIEMAKEADLWMTSAERISAVERFAELARADERRAMMQLFTDSENQPTQHGTVTLECMQREIAAEREECAKVCDRMAQRTQDIRSAALESAAESIRARSNP